MAARSQDDRPPVPVDSCLLPPRADDSVDRHGHLLLFSSSKSLLDGTFLHTWFHSKNDVVLLPGELIPVYKIELGRAGLLHKGHVGREEHRVVALRAHDPDRYLRSFKMLTDCEVAVVLKECQETNIRAPMNTLKNCPAAHVLVTVVNIRGCPTNEHCVYELLWGITVFVDQSDAIEIHISS